MKKTVESGKVIGIRRQVHRRDGGACHYCKGPLPFNKSTLEHIVPVVMGGGWEFWNLGVACADCNSRLGDQYIKCNCDFCNEARRRFEND